MPYVRGMSDEAIEIDDEVRRRRCAEAAVRRLVAEGRAALAARSRMLRSVERGLRAPLGGALTLVEKARLEPDEAQRALLLDVLWEALAAMQEVAADIPALARMEGGHTEPTSTMFPADQTLDRLFAHAADAALIRGVRFEATHDAAGLVVLGFQDRTEDLLECLFTDALERARGAHLKVAARMRVGVPSMFELTISSVHPFETWPHAALARRLMVQMDGRIEQLADGVCLRMPARLVIPAEHLAAP